MYDLNSEVDKNSITKRFVEFLETSVADEIILSSFLRNIKILSSSNGNLYIGVTSSYAVKLLNDDYVEFFNSACTNILGIKLIPIFIEFSKYKNLDSKVVVKKNDEKKYSISHINKKYNFKNYVLGSFNKEAIDAANSIIKEKGKFNPIFIFSKSGFGKTHLLHAIGNELIKENKVIYYISPNEFTNEVRIVMEKKGKYIDDLKNKYSNADYLLIDDIQFLSNRIKTMDVFFDIFNKSVSLNNQLIIVSDKIFNELGGFEDRYLTRFGSGLVLELKNPSLKDFIKIVKEKIKKNIILSERSWDPLAIEFIARNNNSNIRSIESSLNRVEFLLPSFSKDVVIDLNILKEIFKGIFIDDISITSDKIILEVSKYYGVSVANICGKSRKREFIIPRYVSMFLCKKINKLSLAKIGGIFGGRDHSTVINAINKINYQSKINRTTNIAMSVIENNIRRMS